MPDIGFQELLVILVICLLVFGAKRLPEMGASIGKGIREFKRSISEIGHDVESADQAPPPPATRQPSELRGGPRKLSE